MVVYRPSRRRRLVLALLVLTTVTLITLDLRGGGGGPLGSARSGVRDVLAPVQDAVDAVVSPVADWVRGIGHAGALERENRRLRRDLSEARAEAARNAAAAAENEQLRKDDGLTWLGGIRSVAAEVVEGPPGNFERTVTIDKGSGDGLAEGMPVVAGDGLVGRVLRVSGSRATVLLLADPTSGVAVRLPGNDPAVVQGDSGRSTLRMTQVTATTKVAKGDVVVTAGLENGRFPPGIPVGTVDSVQAGGRAGDPPTVRVRPAVDLDRLHLVRVLVWPGG